MMRCSPALCLAIGLLAAGTAVAQGAALPATRGALLYETHCIACHNTQVHWRDQKIVTDWPSLQAQVRRWQGHAGLGWSEDDITEVARHLNQRFYRFEAVDTRVSKATLR